MQALGAALADADDAESEPGSEAAERPAADTLGAPGRRAALFDALTDAEGAPPVQPAPLLAAARWALSRMPTSLDEDEAEERSLLAAGSADPRPLAVIRYRIARKRQLTLAVEVLSRFLGESA